MTIHSRSYITLTHSHNVDVLLAPLTCLEQRHIGHIPGQVHNLHALLTVPLSHFLEKGPFGGTGAGLFGLVARPEVCGEAGPGGGGAGL